MLLHNALTDATVRGLAAAQFGGIQFSSPLTRQEPPPRHNEEELAMLPPLFPIATRTAAGAAGIFLSGWLPNLASIGPAVLKSAVAADVVPTADPDQRWLMLVAAATALAATAAGAEAEGEF